jgi:hypothetical protein
MVRGVVDVVSNHMQSEEQFITFIYLNSSFFTIIVSSDSPVDWDETPGSDDQVMSEIPIQRMNACDRMQSPNTMRFGFAVP